MPARSMAAYRPSPPDMTRGYAVRWRAARRRRRGGEAGLRRRDKTVCLFDLNRPSAPAPMARRPPDSSRPPHPGADGAAPSAGTGSGDEFELAENGELRLCMRLLREGASADAANPSAA